MVRDVPVFLVLEHAKGRGKSLDGIEVWKSFQTKKLIWLLELYDYFTIIKRSFFSIVYYVGYLTLHFLVI